MLGNGKEKQIISKPIGNTHNFFKKNDMCVIIMFEIKIFCGMWMIRCGCMDCSCECAYGSWEVRERN